MSAVSTPAPDRLVAREPSRTPERPSFVANVDLDSDALELGAGHQTHGAVSLAHAQPQQRPAKAAVVVSYVDDCYIAADLTGAVYGAGPSADEALADFYAALGAHLAFLREHVDELHPRLERQLAALQVLFPER